MRTKGLLREAFVIPHTASDDCKRRRLLSSLCLTRALSAGTSASRSRSWVLECGGGRRAIGWTSRECVCVCAIAGSVGARADHGEGLLREVGVEAA